MDDLDAAERGEAQTLVGTVQRMVDAAYLRDVRDTLGGRYFWRKVSDYTEILTRSLIGAGTVLAFAAGTFGDPVLSFVSGSVNTVAMVVGLWVSYANRESRERTRELNAVLRVVGLAPVPDLALYQNVTNGMGSAQRAAN